MDSRPYVLQLKVLESISVIEILLFFLQSAFFQRRAAILARFGLRFSLVLLCLAVA